HPVGEAGLGQEQHLSHLNRKPPGVDPLGDRAQPGTARSLTHRCSSSPRIHRSTTRSGPPAGKRYIPTTTWTQADTVDLFVDWPPQGPRLAGRLQDLMSAQTSPVCNAESGCACGRYEKWYQLTTM